MLKRTIVYTDSDGAEKSEDAYFNLTGNELISSNIVNNYDPSNKEETYRKLIGAAYGVISPDETEFIKSQHLSNEFLRSPACAVFLKDLIADENLAVRFIKGIVPATFS